MRKRVMVDDGDRVQAFARCQVIARPQSAVDEHDGRVGILGEAVDDLQRRVEQFDQVTIFRPDDGASGHELDRFVEVFGKQSVQPPPGGDGVGVGVVVRDDPESGIRGENFE